MRTFLFSILFLLTPPFLSNAFAWDLEQAFHRLKDSGENYQITGAVCEEVARLQLEDVYPRGDFFVVTGIAYGDSRRTIGELDVVVFRSSDLEAVVVGEVKCWRSLGGALNKARQQLSRFDHARRGTELQFSSNEGRFSMQQFDQPVQFLTISQKEGMNAGFDYALAFTLEELMRLRDWLMACQAKGECRRP